MVLDIPATKTRRRTRADAGAEEPRLPPAARPDPERTTWMPIGADRYEVCRGDRVLGYVEVVGPVHVVLAGDRYDRAVEVAQCLLFELAIGALEAAVVGRRASVTPSPPPAG